MQILLVKHEKYLLLFVANPVIESANSMLLLGVWQILGIMGLEKGTKNKRSNKKQMVSQHNSN